MNRRPPNILLIMSDEHDPAVTGCYGDPLVQTPNLDRLARRGVTFDACYCNSPLCVPSRLSFTAGKYISRINAWSNQSFLPDDCPSLPRALVAAGYDAYLCGKQHYRRDRRYGFTDLLPGISQNNGLHPGGPSPRMTLDRPSNLASWTGRSADFRVGDRSSVLDNGRLVTARGVEFFARRDRSSDTKPFFLFAGYVAPHFPMIVPESYASRYRGKVPPPNLPEGLIESLPTNYQMHRRGFGIEDPDPQVVRDGRDLYWALTDWFDDEVGRLLGALDDSGLADDTVVIYTSDHGENKGDHGLWWKNCMYEHGARVPLIVSWPARWAGGQRRSGACSLVDLVQTICCLSGAEPGRDWDGDSLLPYLDDDAHAWKDTAVSEYYGHNIASGMAMIRQGPWKYVYHSRIDGGGEPERELYDLAADPGEFNNLAGEPGQADRVTAMHAALVAELGEEPDTAELRCRNDVPAA